MADPHDPYYRLKSFRGTLCHRIHGLLHVFYAVAEENRLVFIKDVQAMPGRGLDH